MSAVTAACLKCGTLKTGKRSCCARGGAWFKNCGDAGDTNVDHTWAEGIEACRYFVGDASVEISQQDKLRNVDVIVNPLNMTRLRNTTRQRTPMSPADSTPSILDTADFAKVTVCVCVLLIM